MYGRETKEFNKWGGGNQIINTCVGGPKHEDVGEEIK